MVLDEVSLLAEAREKAGGDFADGAFREPLRRLLDSLDREANLNPAGRATQRARLVDSLVTRLTVEGYFREYPKIAQEDLGAPIVIVGLARTGTTMLHRLLASSGDFRVARWWECRYPAPFPESNWRVEDPRIPAAHAEVEAILQHVPVLASIHPWDPEGADEEIMLLEHSFLSHVPESGANLPGYRAWLDDQDLTSGYRYLAQLLRFLQWQQRESGRQVDGPWILKAPFHLGYLDTLFEVFPGARVIQTHRDPLETIPSAASMYRALWELACDEVDPKEVGRQVCERYAWALKRCMATRDRLGANRFLDIDYRAVQRDPLARAQEIYQWLEREPSAAAQQQMQKWLADNPRNKRAAHQYTRDEFGFTREGLAASFREYRARYVADDLDRGSE